MAVKTSRKQKSKSKTKTRPTIRAKQKLPKRKAAPKTGAKKVVKKVVKKTAKKTRVATKKTKTKPKAIKTAKPTAASLPAVASEVATESVARVNAGDWAPDFSIPDQNGNIVNLSGLRGKKVVLYFYPKDDTPGCTKEACSFRDHIGAVQTSDAVIFGVSFDDQASHQKFIEKYGLNFSLLSDLNKDVANAYGCYVEKNMYGNKSWGIERSTFVIDRDGKIAAAFRRVSVDGHTQEVLDALSKIA